MNKLEIELKDGTKLWMDFDVYKAEQEWIKQKERELSNWIFSGQRTIDMFGVEGAKRVLERQHRNDMKECYRHKSRGIK